MVSRRVDARWALLALAVAASVFTVAAILNRTRSSAPVVSLLSAHGRPGELRTSRGVFRDTITLSGELEAARSEVVFIPRVPSWQVPLEWLESDGVEVREGQRLAEIDNTSFLSTVRDKETAAEQATHDLAKEEADQQARIADKAFEVERRRLELEKAKIEASLPADLRSPHDRQEKQLALDAASNTFRKAATDLEAMRVAAAADVGNRRLALEKTRRQIEVAREAIRLSTVRAPQAGTWIVSDLPWEGRKLQVGDQVSVGFPIGSLPDLGSLQIAAALFDVDDRRIRVGQDAVAVLDAYPERSFSARIREVAPVAREISVASLRRAFRVVASLDVPDAKLMRPGLSLRPVVTGQTRANALLVPRAAVDFSGGSPTAQLDHGGRVQVRLGPCNASVCVLEEGLGEGVRVAAIVPAGGGTL